MRPEHRAPRRFPPTSCPITRAVDAHPHALSVQAAPVRARCERTAVRQRRLTFVDERETGSIIGVWSVGVGRSRVLRWVCKPEVTGSIPVRSHLGRARKCGLSFTQLTRDTARKPRWSTVGQPSRPRSRSTRAIRAPSPALPRRGRALRGAYRRPMVSVRSSLRRRPRARDYPPQRSAEDRRELAGAISRCSAKRRRTRNG
jgi:hypothetical protein